MVSVCSSLHRLKQIRAASAYGAADIEIFLILAEELHFGRTATRLYITLARVSQAIKKQERRIDG